MKCLTEIDSHALAPLLAGNNKDCWNRIGVWGREMPRCSSLQDVIHCRNCDVFTQAGRRLFENAANVEYVVEWADSHVSQAPRRATNNESFTVFQLGGEWLALATKRVKEISEIGAAHCIPHRNQKILKGLMSIHGQLVPWIDLGGLMGIAENAEQSAVRKRCMVIEHEQQCFVFSVVKVHGVMRIAGDEMRQAPAASVAGSDKLVKSVVPWSGRNVGCLDVVALVKACNECLL